jgi:hypothetical protein
MRTAFIYLMTLLLCNLASAQGKIATKNPINTPSGAFKKVWSEWIKASGTPLLEARHAELTPNTITLELRNLGTTTLEGEFTANECPDNKKDISGWQKSRIEPGATITLKFPASGCNAGFHWWGKNVYFWSDWFQLNPDKYISARWIKIGTDISVELINHKNRDMSAYFAANFCDVSSKSANGWHKADLPANKTVTLKIADFHGNCNAGFHLWYRDIRGPQQIDDGTNLVPVDGGKR